MRVGCSIRSAARSSATSRSHAPPTSCISRRRAPSSIARPRRSCRASPPEKEDFPMFAVIFEVQPKPDRWDEYLELAKLLKPELERIAGFVDNERFKSR